MPIPLWAAMAAAGLAKGELIDKPAANRRFESEMATLRYSPWTGRQANLNVPEADSLGTAVKWGLAGASLQQANPKMFGGAAAKKTAFGAFRPASSYTPSLSAGKQSEINSYLMSPSMGLEAEDFEGLSSQELAELGIRKR